MRIVLPGALPGPREAGELAAHLTTHAPALQRWLARARPRVIKANPADTGCLPHEYWQLLAHGFTPGPGQNFATGLGPLRGGGSDLARPVWLAELVHVSPARDGAALLPAQELAITPAQSVALFESVRPLFEEDGFHLDGAGEPYWQVTPPQGFTLPSASPALVAITSVNDWWPQDAAARPWRRLVNEIQMLWFDHPVNAGREQAGLPPINSLWLYGGARRDQLQASEQSDVRVEDALLAPATRQDWQAWLAALAALDKRLFSDPSAQAPHALVLTGSDRIIELQPAPQWKQWLPGSRDTWRKWWSPQP
ncbi:hypothetical protein GSY71_16030 [Pusillimonas sp. TS35]|uniref:hypothetical protein n=1 Tax=Paracandidimonas lactea TaxID=2895524 RepID=UPI001370DF02|nr:hypothetical protein [Paracandidimonas lactea]MYN14649.1 hypothetical protein [Pusillimonas sp. TS35]